MKYKFDEKKLLGLFLPDYGHDKLYSEPFLKEDGYVYASDAHKLIRIKADTLNGVYKSKTDYSWSLANDNCDFLITRTDIEDALAQVPQEMETIITECPECEGSGVVLIEYEDKEGETYELEVDCPVCDGSGERERETGKMILSPSASIAIGDFKLCAGEVQLLLETMKIIGVTEVHLVSFSQADNRVVFRIDENISVMFTRSNSEKADAVIPVEEGKNNQPGRKS